MSPLGNEKTLSGDGRLIGSFCTSLLIPISSSLRLVFTNSKDTNPNINLPYRIPGGGELGPPHPRLEH
ncbi:hypothetical protein E2C01_002322 [Portunus trituberculatus]|uniref:Uncharacterized protein n=1 Tax=Portunus trituberculatus TaxID=210409 RepID=A0A5B7CJ30_PORTR|nr:hypothetical protein [Portunus trituberculatus]